MSFIISMLFTGFFVSISTLNLLITDLSARKKVSLVCVILISLAPGYFFNNWAVISFIILTSLYLFFRTTQGILNICSFLSGYMICVVSDNLIGTFFNYVFHITIADVRNNIYILSLYRIINSLLVFFISYIIGKLVRSKVPKIHDLITSSAVQLLLLINLGLCTLIFMINIIAGEQVGYSATVIYFNTAVFVIYFIVSTIITLILFRAYAEKANTELNRQSYESLLDYTRKLETLYSELRSFRHDYLNIMTSMSGYIENDDLDGFSQYYMEHIQPLERHILRNDAQLSSLMQIQQLEIKSFLSVKFLYAMDLNIKISIDVPTPVSQFSIDSIDFIHIIGEWLEHAIEQTRKTSNPEITCAIVRNDKSTTVTITNTFAENSRQNHPKANHIISSCPNLSAETVIKRNACIRKLIIADLESQNKT